MTQLARVEKIKKAKAEKEAEMERAKGINMTRKSAKDSRRLGYLLLCTTIFLLPKRRDIPEGSKRTAFETE